MKKKYNFISRLINKITLNSQSNNDSFSYYGHWVELQSGTVDYMSVTIYNTSDRYSGTLVEFQFDFWTMELCFDAVSCDEVYDTYPFLRPLFNVIPASFSTRNTELRLLKPLAFHISLIRWPLLYIFTTHSFRSMRL